MIHILFCIDEKYKKHCKTVMRSILANTKSDVMFHIVGVDTFDFEANIRLYPIPNTNIIKHRNVLNYITHTAVYRLFAPKMLDVDKVIYLDADLIVLDDIQNLWDIEVDYIAGVQDGMYQTHAERNDLTNTYINSGVMVMNLANLRKLNYFERIEHCQNGFYDLSLLDQDIVNIAFGEFIQLLPEKWNVYSKKYPELTSAMIKARQKPSIIHWCGRKKPYNAYVWQQDKWSKYDK